MVFFLFVSHKNVICVCVCVPYVCLFCSDFVFDYPSELQGNFVRPTATPQIQTTTTSTFWTLWSVNKTVIQDDNQLNSDELDRSHPTNNDKMENIGLESNFDKNNDGNNRLVVDDQIRYLHIACVCRKKCCCFFFWLKNPVFSLVILEYAQKNANSKNVILWSPAIKLVLILTFI